MENKDFNGMPIVAWVLDDKRKAALLIKTLNEWHHRLSFITTTITPDSGNFQWYKVLISNGDGDFDSYSKASRDADFFLAGYQARVIQEMDEN